MLEFPVYPEIDRLFGFYGFEVDDLIVFASTFGFVEWIVNQARVHVAHTDLTLPLTVLATLVLFGFWRAAKAGRPRHFLEDAMGAFAEPDLWILTEDREVRPSYLIEPNGRMTIAPSDRAWPEEPP